MKLYKVRVEYETVIRAESQERAEKDAPYIIHNEADEEPVFVNGQEIETLKDLPRGWDGYCLPWGERDPHDKMIGDLIRP